MLSKLRRRLDEHSKKINKDLEKYKEEPTELKNTITEIKKYTSRNQP